MKERIREILEEALPLVDIESEHLYGELAWRDYYPHGVVSSFRHRSRQLIRYSQEPQVARFSCCPCRKETC